MSRYSRALEKYGRDIVLALLEDQTGDRQFPELKSVSKDSLTDETVHEIFQSFAKLTDPTANAPSQYKFLDWICKAYIEAKNLGAAILAEDLYKVKDDLKDFESFSQLLPPEQRDINYHRDYHFLLMILMPHQQRRAERKELDELNEEAKANTTILYEGPEGKVLIPKTMEASQFWGQQTRWCISARHSNFFELYNKRGPIYMFLPTPTQEDKTAFKRYSSHKFCGTGGDIYDEHDKVINYTTPGLKRLFNAAAENIPDWNTRRRLRKHTKIHELHDVTGPDNGKWVDKKALLKALDKSPAAFQFASEELQKDVDCIKKILGDIDAVSYAPKDIILRPEFAKEVYLNAPAIGRYRHQSRANLTVWLTLIASGAALGAAFGMAADPERVTTWALNGFNVVNLGHLSARGNKYLDKLNNFVAKKFIEASSDYSDEDMLREVEHLYDRAKLLREDGPGPAPFHHGMFI